MQKGQGGPEWLQMGFENGWRADANIQKPSDSSAGEWVPKPTVNNRKRKAKSEPEGESSVEREDKVLRKCHCRGGLLQATAIKLAPKINLCVHAEGGFTLVSV